MTPRTPRTSAAAESLVRSAAVPTAVVGTIALSLTGLPAAAAEKTSTERLPSFSAASNTARAIVAPVRSARDAPTSHTVRRGDTVYRIAAAHGLRTADVLAWNGLNANSTIYPGQKLALRGATAQPARSSASAAKASTSAARSSARATYTVRSGDSVWAIANRHDVSVASLLSANNLSKRALIHPGQKLAIPGEATPTHTSQAKPTAASTPSKPASAKPARAGKTHTVARGDSLWSIARDHKTSVANLQKLNRLSAGSYIHPGQKLIVSAGASTASATASRPAPAKPASAKPASSAGSHTVKAGETMWRIASANGITVARLLSANGLNEGSIIYPGQKLRIPGDSASLTSLGLDAEQARNVRTIVSVGRELGVSDRGIAIALATAMVESWIRNLDWGDRDSLGLFQQRPSQGWGSAAQIRDPRTSARAFYLGTDRARGLLDIRGWEKMGFSQAAQAVQISAYPERYGQWEKRAYAWLDAAD